MNDYSSLLLDLAQLLHLYVTVVLKVLTIVAVEDMHIVYMKIVGLYFEPALETMRYELVPGCKKFIMKDVRMVVKLDKALNGCIESAKGYSGGAWVRTYSRVRMLL